MLNLDDKLISFLRTVHVKGEVVIIHEVCAAVALIQSNPS